jgi:outer membrane protein OmpA-like peptidoglycan-associated protein
VLARRRLSLAFNLSIALICFSHIAPSCFAQESVNADANVQAADCPPLSMFPQLATSVVVSCHKGDSIEVTMPLKPDAQGRGREKTVRGQYEFREYRIPQADQQENAFNNLMQLIPIAGFIVKFAASPSVITAQNGDTWILVNVNGDSYNVSVVRDTQIHCTVVKNSDEMLREMEAHNRAAIYGIQFSAENQIIEDKSSEILTEVLKYLKQNPDRPVLIESHKVSTKGTEEDDLEITRQRANAVVDWLVARGVPAARLQAKPFGRSKPITDNDTPTEIQCNERIVFAKAAS